MVHQLGATSTPRHSEVVHLESTQTNLISFALRFTIHRSAGNTLSVLIPMNRPLIHVNEGALNEVVRIVEQLNPQRIMFVFDEDAYKACGADAVIEATLVSRSVTRFSGFDLNPKLDDIRIGIEHFRQRQHDLVIALGGGTAMDIGKLVRSLSVQSSQAHDIIVGRAHIDRRGPPLIAVPTTAGTGSEATHFAVAYIDQQKYSVAHQTLLPDYAIVDPCLTHSLPARMTAATGLDAMCQAIESIWAVQATDQSIAFAEEALRRAVAYLVPAVQRPTPAARLEMCHASHLAGKAINISKTTAAHALSYTLTSEFNLPHGAAVAATLAPILAYNAAVDDDDCADPRGAAHVRSRVATIVELLGANTTAEACARFQVIVEKCGCPASLGKAGITRMDQLQHIVNAVNAERMSNNPRRTSFTALIDLLTPELDLR